MTRTFLSSLAGLTVGLMVGIFGYRFVSHRSPAPTSSFFHLARAEEREERKARGTVSEAFLTQHSLILAKRLGGEPLAPFREYVRIMKVARGGSEMHIRVWRDTGLAGSGYDFFFD